jgi:hypothetical protein
MLVGPVDDRHRRRHKAYACLYLKKPGTHFAKYPTMFLGGV